MNNSFTFNIHLCTSKARTILSKSLFFICIFLSGFVSAATKNAVSSGNWSNGAIWSPSGVPASGDDVIINSGTTITVDSSFTCNHLSIGNSTNASATLKIIASGNSLTVNGDLDFNAQNRSYTYTIDAGPGEFTFAGTFSHWSTAGTNRFQVSTGSISFSPAVAITDASQYIVFTGGGTINFNSNFSDAYNRMTFYNGCNVNFHGNYTISGYSVNWANTGTANFYGTGTITPTKSITFNTVNIQSGAATTLAASGTGAIIIGDNLTVNSTASFTMNDNFQLNGNFTNNGTLTAGAITLTMKGSGTTQTIGGAAALSLPTLQIGSGNGSDINVVIAQNTTVAALTYATGDKNRTVSINSGKTLTVTGNLTMPQRSRNNYTTLLSVGSGNCEVNGNLIFSGYSNTISRASKITVGSGSFTLDGTLTWFSNSSVATEVITVSTGTLNFNSSVTLGSKSGTISVTSSGDINFNGSSAPSLTFGGSTAPVLTAAYGATINIANGLTTNTSALTMARGSSIKFTGNGTITPNASLTFANFKVDSGVTVTAAGNFSVSGNWTNSGTFSPSTHTVTFTGSGTKTINRSGGETFYKLTASQYGATVKLLSHVLVSNTLTMSGSNFNLNGYTLTLGDNAGATLVRSAGQVYGGTFKRWWPTTAITGNSSPYYGLFPMGTISAYRNISINSTANPTTAGYVSATHTDATGATTVNYTDNEGSIIQQIANQHSDLSTSGLAGGTYNIDVKFTGLGSQGSVSDYKLETYTGSVMGSCGDHVTTLGPTSAPTAKRTGLSVTNLNNAWVVGTNDATGSPLYTYVYSRKSGNWNDSSATGTWSYTAGGSGAACNCLPTAGGYAVIEDGHSVTVTATDTIQFLDIKTNGSLTINTGTIFNVTANMDMFGAASFSNNGTLNVTGELLFSPSASQTFSGDVTVSGWFTLDSGATYTHSSGTLTITGDMEIDGDMSLASGANIAFSGVNSILSGSGTFTTAAGGTLSITNDKVIAEGTSLTIGTSGVNTGISLAANTNINNLGTITLNGNMTGADAVTSVWINNANSRLNISGDLLVTGILDAVTSPNIVDYNGSGSQTLKVPAESYHSLLASNSGNKSCPADIMVDSLVDISGTAVLDEGTNKLYGDANLKMTGNSELKLSRNTDGDVYPELRGIFECTSGTVTITQTGDSATVASGPYYNLKLNGTQGYDLGGVSTIANNLDCQSGSWINNNSVLTIGGMFTYSSSAVSTLTDSIAAYGIALTGGEINDGGNSININGAGGWSLNSSATFTPTTGAVYFTGNGSQTLGGTAVTQNFNSLCVNKSSGTVTVGGSVDSIHLTGEMILNAGVLDNGSATSINMSGGNWNNNGGSFTAGTGTVIFSGDSVDQAIQGTATAELFNHVTVNKPGYTLTVGGSVTRLSLSGNMTLANGIFNAGTATGITMSGGNWTNNDGSFNPAGTELSFTGTGAQQINGTDTAQTFYKLTVNKSAGTLSVAGSTTVLTANSDIKLSAGTFSNGTANNIYLLGNWTNNGGVFAFGTGNVECSSGFDQAINGSNSSQGFYNLTINKSAGYVRITESINTVAVNNTLAFTNGRIATGTAKVSIPINATVTGAGAGNYIFGNEEIYIPNTTAPTRTFHVGDSTVYAPVTLNFSGTVSGSGAITGSTAFGDDADITTSGINENKSVNRTWELANNGVAGFSSYSPTFNFVAADIDAGTNTDSVIVRRWNSGTWYSTTIGSRSSTNTQTTGETGFGRTQIGEKAPLSVSQHPSDTGQCTGNGAAFSSSSSSTPPPTVKWQRDPNTGSFADIDGSTDGAVYSGFTANTLIISNVSGLNNYKYRAVFTNINGSVTSNQATLTETATPSITGTTPGSRCDAGTVSLAATASAGTINWYADSTGGSALGTGTGFTTPSISVNTTYYTDATSGGCTTASRTAVLATVNATPTVSGSTPGERCGNGTVNLGATASAGTIKWYAVSSGGAALDSGTAYTTGSLSATTNYYAEADNGGCISASRTLVEAAVHPTPSASVDYQSCAGVNGETTLRITGTGGEAPYTYKINSNSFSSSDTFHVANGSTNNFYVTDNHNCPSGAYNHLTSSLVPSQISSSSGTTTCSCSSASECRDVYLTDASGNLIAVINDKGHDLGTVTATVYVRAASVLVANNQGGNDAALSRSFVLDFNGTGLIPAVEVKFPYTNAEFNDLVTASANTPIPGDDVLTAADLGDTQFEGPNEDSTYNTTGATLLAYHRQIGYGTLLNGNYVKIGLSANGEHWLGGNGGGNPLPVTLVSFNATANDALQEVETEWTTSLEINNHYFAIERSEDGMSFTEIGRVTGAGNHTGNLHYQFTDQQPIAGLAYYRLKQVDLDGQYEYSGIVPVTLGNNSNFSVYPNPAEDVLNIAIANPGPEIVCSIFDVSGKKVFEKTFQPNRLSKTESISLPAKQILAAGIYMLHITTHGISQNQKVVLR